MRKLSIGGGLVLRQMLFLAVIAAFGAYLWLLINQLRDVLRQALVPGSIGQEALAAAGAQAESLSLARNGVSGSSSSGSFEVPSPNAGAVRSTSTVHGSDSAR